MRAAMAMPVAACAASGNAADDDSTRTWLSAVTPIESGLKETWSLYVVVAGSSMSNCAGPALPWGHVASHVSGELPLQELLEVTLSSVGSQKLLICSAYPHRDVTLTGLPSATSSICGNKPAAQTHTHTRARVRLGELSVRA